MSNPKRIENLKLELARDIEREKYKKFAAVITEITEKVIKNLETLEESRIIMKVIENLEEEPRIENIARKIEFNELIKRLNTKLIEESKKSILSIAEYITNGKNLKIKPLESSLKDKCISYGPELPF